MRSVFAHTSGNPINAAADALHLGGEVIEGTMKLDELLVHKVSQIRDQYLLA
jgi:hypothetical protein